MATILETINQVLTYENEPERQRELLKNTFELTEEQVTALMQAIESIPEDYTQLVSVVEGLVASYGALENTVEDLSGDVDDLKADLNNKANADGSYEQMTVGNAEQLVSSKYTEDQTPYLFRTSGGSADVGNREEDVIVGGSVAWNQLVSMTDGSQTVNGITNTKTESGIVSASGTADGNAAFWLFSANTYANHVYLLTGCPTGGGSDKWALYANELSVQLMDYGAGSMKKMNADARGHFYFITYVGTSIDATFAPKLFDLTQMFGSAIADAAYSKEQASAGSGIAWLKSMGFFTADYYPYDAGTLKSVEGLVSHDMVGFNAYNPTTGTAEVIGGQQYQITGTYTAITLDGETITPDSNGLFTPSANGTLSVTGGNATDTCVHLVWSGYRNGEYEAYTKHSYPLDSSLTLRGVPKVNSAGELYYDGDEYLPDGTVNRRYAEVDLGTLTWNYNADWGGSGAFYISGTLPNGYIPSLTDAGRIMNIKSSKYVAMSRDDLYATSNNGVCLPNGGGLTIRDSVYTDAATFKAAMSGVMLIYELANPITASALPYASPQIVDDFGTEEYVIDSSVTVPVPVGHDTKYLANLRDKLQHLPDLASSDGYYLINQTDNEMTLEQFRIPKAPETNGTYVFKATVSGGTPTYTWEAET